MGDQQQYPDLVKLYESKQPPVSPPGADLPMPAMSVRTPVGGYKIGDPVSMDGNDFTVSGFRANGSPILDLKPKKSSPALTPTPKPSSLVAQYEQEKEARGPYRMQPWPGMTEHHDPEPYIDPLTGYPTAKVKKTLAKADAVAKGKEKYDQDDLAIIAKIELAKESEQRSLELAKRDLVDPFETLSRKGAEAGREALPALLHPPARFGVPMHYQTSQTELGIERAVGGSVGGMVADPRMWPLAFMPEGPAARMLSLGFSVQMASGVVDQTEQLKKIWDRNDVPTADKVEMGTSIILGSLMAAGAFAHVGHGDQRVPLSPDAQKLLNSIPKQDRDAVQQKIDERMPQIIAAIEQKLGRPLGTSTGKPVEGMKPPPPGFLQNMSKRQVELALDRLRMRTPKPKAQEDSKLPFEVTDLRGETKEEGSGVHIIDAPVLSPQEREYRRQDQREQETLELIRQERAEQERRTLGNAQRYKDQVAEQLERERALETKDKRRVAPVGLIDLRERMETMANQNMYESAADMARSLLEKKPRGKALTEQEKDFLKLWEERKRLVSGVSGVEEARVTKVGQEELNKEAGRVETEHKLREASARLNKEATKAKSPEETQDKAEKADEALRHAEQIKTDVERERAAREAAKQKQQEYPMGVPINTLVGNTTQVRLPDGRKLPARYAVVKASDLIISHDPESFEWNEKYQPQKMQPRDYKKNKEAQAGVIAGGNDFESDSFHNTDNTGHNGPSIILSDGRVAGGNGRAMRLMRAYKGEQGEAIRNDLVNKASQFGIDARDIPPVEEMPVLVRVLDNSPTDLQGLIELGQDLNRDETRGFSAAEQAVMSGERLSQDTLEWVGRRLDDMGEDASVRELMQHNGFALAQKLIQDGVISPTKRAEFVTAKGELTTRAKDTFENALLGKVISDADLIATMPKQIKDKLFRSLAPLAKIKASEPAWDFTDYLEEAVRHWKRIDSIPDTLDAYGKKSRSEQYMEYQNGKMIKEPIHPAVEALIRLLDKKPSEIKSAFYKYIDDYEGRQQTLVGEPPNPRMAFNKDIAEKVGVEIKSEEWGTVHPIEKPVETAKAAKVEDTAADDFSELQDVPTDQLEADLEQLRGIVDDENDPMLQAYLRELSRRGNQGSEAKLQTTKDSGPEPGPAKPLQRQDAAIAAERRAFKEAQSKVEPIGARAERRFMDSYGSISSGGSWRNLPDDVPGIKEWLYTPEEIDLLRKEKSAADTLTAAKDRHLTSLIDAARSGREVPQDVIDSLDLYRKEKFLLDEAERGKQIPQNIIDALPDKYYREKIKTAVEKSRSLAEEHRSESVPVVKAAKAALDSVREDADLAKALATAGPLNEEKLRDILSQHPNYSAGKVGAAVSVMKSFAEKYLGMGFDEWLRKNIAEVRVGGSGPERTAEPETEGALFQRKMDPLPGFEHTFEERKEAKAEYEGEQLSKAILEKKGDISRKSGDIERNSPLFSAVNASGQHDLFSPTPLETHATQEDAAKAAQDLELPPKQQTLFQHGESMASVEELARGEVFYRVGKGGKMTYQGVSPDANLQPGEALIGVKRDGSMRVQNHRMDMPDPQVIDRVRPRVLKAVADLVKQDRYYQMNKGSVDFLKDGRAIIHLMENADISTILHEFAHVARRNLKPEDRGTVEGWLKIKDGIWHVMDEEKFARAFEKYLYDGDAPTPEMKGVFARIRDWMVDVYKTVKGSSINVRFPDEVRRVFDRMVAGEDRAVVEQPREDLRGAANKERDKLTKKLKAPVTNDEMEKFFTPGRIVPSYPSNTFDRVIRFNKEANGDWSVTVVHVDKDGKVLPGERERTHSTRPTVDEVVKAGLRDEVKRKLDELKSAKPPAEPAERKKLSNAIEEEARKIQSNQEAQGEAVTPAERLAATKIAEGGEALGERMTEARMRTFPDQEQAIQWANANQNKIRGIELYTLQDGRGFAHFLPKDPNVLFQEVEPAEIERRLRLIDERMQKIIPDAERARLGKMRQELLAQKSQNKLALTPTPNEIQGKTIKLWTPEGEREITDAPRKADSERRPSAPPAELQEPRRTERVSEQARRSGSTAEDRSAGRDVRGSDQGGRAKRDGGEPRKALRDVEPAKLDAPAHERGTELYTKEQWADRAKLLRLPENAPAPTVRIPSSLRRMLIFPGQPEVVESALSGLKQHDAYIIATSTGSGKTYTGSAIISQLHRPGMKTLVLTTSKDLIHQRGNGWIAVARDFDVDMQELPPGVSFPDEPGVYVTTDATAIGREGIENGKWNLVVRDEVGQDRKWYSSQRGAMMKTLANNANKVLYMSATPFHTALELGHMDKLGLWREQGFAAWGKQFGIYKDADGNWAGGNAPKKLIKLREQLIERGQFINLDRNMDGFETSFAQVPLTQAQIADINNIKEAFSLAEDYFKRTGRKSMIRAVKGNAVTYVKKYLERIRLPQAIEMAKKLDKEGWKVILFSETKSERSEIFDFLQPVDEALGGRLSDLLPPLPEVPEELEKAFGEDLANYSGPHSAFRTSEKDAFNDGQKKHIYVSYAAGGIGVSLHDTSGVKPRAVIYLGPPYSGVMFDQAIGRAWRYGTKSNVHAIFMTSNARPEIHLILEKVAPRMSSLRALVSGIDEQDKFVNTLRNMDSVREGQLAYELGNKVKVEADDFAETENTHAIQSWKDVKIQSAETAKNKGMKFPEEPAHGPEVIKLFQQDEHEASEPPEDFELPAEHSAKLDNQIQRAQFENGDNPLPGPYRTAVADDIASQALAELLDPANGDPTAAVSERWDNAKKYVKTVWDSVEGSRPVRAAKVQDMYWLTNGRKVIRDVAGQAGARDVGVKIARMLPEYHVEWGNISGPWVQRYREILKDSDISTKRKVSFRDPKTGETKEVNEHHNLVMAKQGKQPPANDRIARAVEQTTKMMNDVRARLAKENVAVEVFDSATGEKRRVPFSEIMDDPHYWPRKYDPEYEIRTTDPDTGKVEVTKLKDLLGGDLGEAKRNRIMRYMMKEHGMSRAQAEDFMEGRGRDVPLVGNVERAREYDLPFYRTDPGAMVSYLEGAGEAAARTKVFGQGREKLEKEITKVPNVKARARIREIMDSVLSKRPFDQETKDMVSLAADYSVMTKMTFSALKAIGHPVHAALSSNTRAFLRGFAEAAGNWKEAHANSVFSGSILEQYKTEMLREYGAKRKISSKFLDLVGFQGTYEFGRVWADATARQYLNRYALPKLIKGRSADFYRRTLKDVYLLSDDAIDKAIDRGGWTDEDLHRAGKALSDKTMFTFDPSELPPAWRARSQEPIADNVLAGVRIMTLLKGYMFKTSALLRERIWDEAKQGNFRPLVPFLLLYPAMGEVIADLGALFTANRKRYDDLVNDKDSLPARLLYRYISDMAHATGLTLLDTLLEAAFRQHNPMYAARDVYEFSMGPLLADLVHTFIQLPMELISAETKKRGTTAGEKRYNALIRWLRSTMPVTSPVVNLMKEDKKVQHRSSGSADYQLTPIPTH